MVQNTILASYTACRASWFLVAAAKTTNLRLALLDVLLKRFRSRKCMSKRSTCLIHIPPLEGQQATFAPCGVGVERVVGSGGPENQSL
jgi:hypothetical protein